MKENIYNDEKMMPFHVHDSRWPILESYRIMPSHRLWRLWPPPTSDLVFPPCIHHSGSSVVFTLYRAFVSGRFS